MQTKELKSKHPKELVEHVRVLLAHNQDALNFVVAYGEYAELVDDLVDEVFCVKRLARMTALASQLFTSNYWQQRGHQLLMVEQLNNLSFFHTVEWEKAPEQWKRTDARSLNHTAYNMLFAILILEHGIEKVREITLRFRESAHLNQLTDTYEEPSKVVAKQV